MAAVMWEYFSGVVREKVFGHVSDQAADPLKQKPKEKARTPEEQLEVNHRQSQLNFIRMVNANFGPWAFYFTGTFCDAWLPQDFAEAKRLLRNFLRRLRTSCPGVLAVGVVGRGKWTDRLHVHCIISGVSQQDIEDKWQYGDVAKLEHLRKHNYYDGVDHGADYTGLAVYLHDHWTPEQGGNRWQRTGKLTPHDKEKTSMPKRSYAIDKPPAAPKGHMLVEQRELKGGGLYFKYVKVPAHEPGIPFKYTGPQGPLDLT